MAALNQCSFRKIWLSVHQAVLKILAFSSHCSAKFQLILNCFIPNFKLKYEDSENIKSDPVSTVGFNLHQIKRRALFLGHPVIYRTKAADNNAACRNTQEVVKLKVCPHDFGGNAHRGTRWHSMQSFGGPFHSQKKLQLELA